MIVGAVADLVKVVRGSGEAHCLAVKRNQWPKVIRSLHEIGVANEIMDGLGVARNQGSSVHFFHAMLNMHSEA